MGQILIRGLDEGVVKRLKARAQRHGRSVQAEVRLILERAAGYTTDQAAAAAEGWRRRLAGRTAGDSTDLVREDRER